MPVNIESRNEIIVLSMDNGKENTFNLEMIQQFNEALNAIETNNDVRGVVVTGASGHFFSAGLVDELADQESVMERALKVAAELGAKKPRLFAEYKKRFRGETADCMLNVDLRYIDEEMDVSMFQNCDLSCLQSLS